MKIEQAHVSATISIFRDSFHKNYGLREYVSNTSPAIFFGCYQGPHDWKRVIAHKGFAVIAYGGGDARWLYEHRNKHKGIPVIKALRSKRNLYHIASSKCNMYELKRMGFNPIFLPVCPIVPKNFNPCPLGDSVYVYGSHTQPDFYGEPISRQVEQALIDKGHKTPFIYGYALPPGNVKLEDMPSIYAKCFIGLRPVQHDGLSTTVIELGMMGRRCFWNEIAPNAIPWQTVDGIANRIIEEKKLIGTTNNAVAEETSRFINFTDNWLDTEYYEKTVR
jgi:hypothetical protein